MRSAVTVLLLLLLAPARAGEEKLPPTPQERIARMKAKCAEARAKLGKWAAGKKLGDLAPAQFLLALRLDPDCRTARSKLGFRRNEEGGWVPPRREKAWKLDARALERCGADFASRERVLLDAELSRFEELGKVLIAEGEVELGRRLCLRVHLMDPARSGAAEALGLVPLMHSFAEPEVAEAVSRAPQAELSLGKGPMAEVLRIETSAYRCGPALAETVGDPGSAKLLARAAHQAGLLTAQRFRWPSLAKAEFSIPVCDVEERYHRFLEKCGLFDSSMIAAAKVLRCARGRRPQNIAACCLAPGEDPQNWLANCIHMAAEDSVCWTAGGRVPVWLFESAGVDAAVTLLGRQGPLCCPLEESAGLTIKDAMNDPAEWGRLLLRRIGLCDLPPVVELIRRPITELSNRDMIVAYALYRYLHRTQRQGLWPYLRRVVTGTEEHENVFHSTFGVDLEERWIGLLAGAD